jgi:hypothetical protein
MLYVLIVLCLGLAAFCFWRVGKAKYDRHIWWCSIGICLLIAFMAFATCSYTDYYINHGPKRILCVDNTSKEVLSVISKGGIVTHGSNSFEFLIQDDSPVIVVGLSCIITEL